MYNASNSLCRTTTETNQHEIAEANAPFNSDSALLSKATEARDFLKTNASECIEQLAAEALKQGDASYAIELAAVLVDVVFQDRMAIAQVAVNDTCNEWIYLSMSNDGYDAVDIKRAIQLLGDYSWEKSE